VHNPAEQARPEPLTLARHGASAVEAPASRAAFELGLRLGASGIDSAAWLTADGVPVVHEDGHLKQRLRRVPISRLDSSAVPEGTMRLTELLGLRRTAFDLVLDVEHEAAATPVLETLDVNGLWSGSDAARRVWLRHHDWRVLASLRAQGVTVHLVHRTRRRDLTEGPERHAAQLGSFGIDAVQMPYPDWTGGLVVLFRRFEVSSFASEAEHARMIRDLRGMKVSAISTRHPDRFAG